MSIPTARIAGAFEIIDVHDDIVEGFSFHPAVKRGARSKVTVTLFRPWKNSRRLLTFNGCANFEVILDSEILADNALGNTASVDATADAHQIEAMMRRHRRSWNVSYEKRIDPMPSKVASASQRVLFRVRLFGGVLVVIASSFSIKRVRTALSESVGSE